MNVYVIAGPNGSGKTTFARKFLPDYAKCPNFINADLIAQGLAPFGPHRAEVKAGRLVLQQIRSFSARGIDFAFETTLAGKSYARLFKTLKRQGYAIHLFFLWIPDPALAIARIKDRVASGGHDVPGSAVRRRFTRGLANFFALYRSLSDSWMLFDNSGIKPSLIAKGKGGAVEIARNSLFNLIAEKRGNE
jgi:predicted ABC-type ATPase